MDILASEPQHYPGARVTDETYLFLFRAVPMFVTSFELDHDFEGEDFSVGYDNNRIVADAEKGTRPEWTAFDFAGGSIKHCAYG